MRNMSKIYQKLSDSELRTRLSKANVELERVQANHGLWRDRDVRELLHIKHQIEVELTYRFFRQELPLDY